MVQFLEVMSGEDSGLMDASLDVSTSAGGAPSTSRGWMRRFLLVAVPFCVVVFGYIGMQALRSNNIEEGNIPWNSDTLLEGKTGDEGLDIDGITALQCLTTWPFQLERVYLKGAYYTGLFQDTIRRKGSPQKMELYANADYKYHERLEFHAHRCPEALKSWPSAIPRLKKNKMILRAEGAFPGNQAEGVDNLMPMWQELGKPVSKSKFKFAGLSLLQMKGVLDRVHYSRDALDALLGSAHGEPAAAGTWTAQAASVFGVCWGETAENAPGAGPRQGARGWLAQDLLEGRVRSGKEPLVLSQELQKEVAAMDESQRSAFLDQVGRGVGAHPLHVAPEAEVAAAYEIIAELFCFVKRCAKANIDTVLDVDDFFSLEEVRELLRPKLRSADKPTKYFATELLASVQAAEQKDNAFARRKRSGPRFLLSCWLTLEQEQNSKGRGEGAEGGEGDEKDEEAEIAAAAKYLRDNPETILRNTDLLPLLKTSKLHVYRRGSFTSKCDETIPLGIYERTNWNADLTPITEFTDKASRDAMIVDSKAFKLLYFPKFLARKLKEEQVGTGDASPSD